MTGMAFRTKQFLMEVASWPDEDVEILMAAAREIAAWQNGDYQDRGEEFSSADADRNAVAAAN